MSNFILRGATLAHVVTQNNEATTFVRINVRGDLTDAVRQELGWNEMGPHETKREFDNELGEGRLSLRSEQQALNAPTPELNLHFDECGTFRVCQVKGETGDSTRNEIRFHIRTTSPEAAGLCQEYKRNAKKGLGEMRIVFGPEAKDEVKVADAFANAKSDDGQLTIVESMKAANGHREKNKRTRGQMADAVAEVTVEVDPAERARMDAVIDGSFN